MKKLPYITAAITVLLLYIFSLAPSVEEKITWGGIYPPPTPEFSWKKMASFKRTEHVSTGCHQLYESPRLLH